MSPLQELQKEIFENKKRHGFNTTDLNEEFCHLYGEVAEAHDAWYKGLDTFPEELADVAIFLLGIAEIRRVNLGQEIIKKVEKICMSLPELQKEIYENKKRHGFNITDLNEGFCHLYGEVAEAHDAWYKGLDIFPEKLADVAIFLLGIAEIREVNLEQEIIKKVEKNKRRKYVKNSVGNFVKAENES